MVKTFRRLDEEAAAVAPSEIMRRIQHGLPEPDGVARKSELGALRHQLGLQRPSMPIRALLGSIGSTLPKLAPCVLMSPLSIAQYLPAGQPAFDVVIFDEASQITTWDAVGAIARGRQAIIVGDPKQLPPSNFFGRSEDDEDVPELERDPLSILDEVATAGIPTRELTWHYRSRDEALIAFSNHFYYGGRLVTFPAPADGVSAVAFHRVARRLRARRGTAQRDRGQGDRRVRARPAHRLARAARGGTRRRSASSPSTSSSSPSSRTFSTMCCAPTRGSNGSSPRTARSR